MWERIEVTGIPNIKCYLVIYVVFAMILLILTIVDASQNNWYEYCFWNFGLEDADPIDSDEDTQTIGYFQDEVCSRDETFYSSACPGVCDHLKAFQHGGKVMTSLMIVSSFATLCSGALHALAICGRYSLRYFYIVWVSLAMLAWLSGIIAYGIITNIASFDDTKGSASNVEVKGGVGLCIFLVVFHLAVTIYAFIFTRKAFLFDLTP